MIRALLTSIVLAAAVLAAPGSLAQDTVTGSPRFFIERIEVRNHKRVSPEVVIAESRLREGGEYSESDLRDASTRLARLPFLLAADFALEKGSERGRYLLIINIIETRSLFFRLEFVPIYSRGGNIVSSPTTSHLGSDDTGVALGYRWFVGRRGALHIALIGREHTEFTAGYSAFALGYTQYDLFGTRGFATVNIKHNPEGGRISPQVVVGMPLSLNQTVTAEYDELVTEYDYSVAGKRVDESQIQRVARATWSYNTTNHPFFPTNGTLLSIAPVVSWRDDVSVTLRSDGAGGVTVDVDPIHRTTFGIQATAVQYFELSDRTSASGGLEVGVAQFDQRAADAHLLDQRSAAFAGGQATISRSLWTPERRAQGGDSRIELELRVRGRQEYRADYQILNESDQSLRTSISWLRQSSWGNVRLGLGYTW